MHYTILLLLTVVDASGKLPSGILLGNTNWLGMYDECLEISSKQSQAHQQDNITVLGEYCLVNIGDGSPPSDLPVSSVLNN